MNTIDIHNGWANNLKWQAKKQAELDNIYDNERLKYSSDQRSQNDTDTIYTKLSIIENKLDRIENKIDKLCGIINNFNEGNGLFVFAPSQNVKANIAFNLSESQFEELVDNILNTK